MWLDLSDLFTLFNNAVKVKPFDGYPYTVHMKSHTTSFVVAHTHMLPPSRKVLPAMH